MAAICVSCYRVWGMAKVMQSTRYGMRGFSTTTCSVGMGVAKSTHTISSALHHSTHPIKQPKLTQIVSQYLNISI